MLAREIKTLTHELRLLGMHNSIDRRLEASKNEGLNPADVVLQLLQDERQHRKNIAAKTLETKAKFRRESLLENWDSSFERGISRSKLRELSELGFWQLKKNLVIVGSTGSGKTHTMLGYSNSPLESDES